jgi:asparagine synthase (glutamine-hydrolysing)
MWSPNRRFVFAYNGEVYNFAKLRDELTRAGERFAGASDTEVVLRLLARDGERSLARLDGMFALALLDTQSGEVLLARDRTGQKPLYWAALAGGGFAFASETAPLLRVPGVDTSLDPQGLGHLLTFGFVPNPWSLRAGIRQLRPGTALRLRADATDRGHAGSRSRAPASRVSRATSKGSRANSKRLSPSACANTSSPTFRSVCCSRAASTPPRWRRWRRATSAA